MKKLLILSCPVLFLFTLPTSARADDSVPETKAQYDARLAWWRDAKYGMFIHWGPVSLEGKELSWSRHGTHPLDISGEPAGAVEDPEYDTLYKEFNPDKFDAKEWVKTAQNAGMKYLVFVCKHHDGFSMFGTKLSDYSITHSPFKRDPFKELADACHAAGLRLGVYYSPRDWTNPNYGVGDNQNYVDYMNGQLKELLTNYGKIDILWFDSYGTGDLVDFWKIGSTWSLIKSLQPDIIVNNRLAVLAAYNQQPVAFRGDFDTPEQFIGGMSTNRAWESSMCLVDHQWSFKPGGDLKSLDEIRNDLVSCAAGNGNLLLDVGPMSSGEIEGRQVDRLKELGDWLKKYGDSIYATRGGPYLNGRWGGSTYRDKTVYLHVLNWPADILRLGPLTQKVVSYRLLTGGTVQVVQTDKGLDVTVEKDQRAEGDTVIELTLDQPVTGVRDDLSVRSMFEDPQYGQLISADATLTTSSSSPTADHQEFHSKLFTGDKANYAFHTDNELNPSAVIDLGQVKTIMGIRIENRPGDTRSSGLKASLSEDGQTYTPVWQAADWDNVWEFPVTQTVAGAQVPGRHARYLKLEKTSDRPGPLLLRRVEVYGNN